MLSSNETERVQEIAELQVRRYFDNYLNEVFPKQIAAVMEAHDKAADAHGGIRGKFAKFRWTLIGFAAGGGALGGAGLSKLLPFFH